MVGFLYIIQIWATNSRKNGTKLELTMVNGTILYEQLHNIAITSSYNLNEKWSFGALILHTTLVNPSPYPVGKMNVRNDS
jgi:hypothetical protein